MSGRRIWNPPDPHTSESREYLDGTPAVRVEVFEDSSRSIVTKNESPDVDFTYGVNPYRGCQHACAYCYARPTHEYLGLGAGTDFERKLLVKRDAPALLEAHFRKPSWKGDLVAFSGVTDCYQPLEASYALTRGCLEVCRDFRNPVGIITKSPLVCRDLDVLGEIAAESYASVHLSIPFLDETVCRKLEPGAPPPARRFEAMARLADAGIPVGVSVSPIIPGLNEPDIPGILERARDHGATRAFMILLRLPGNTEAVFLRRLESELPDRAERIRARILDCRGGRMNDPRMATRGRGVGSYWDTVEQTWRIWIRRLGFETTRMEAGTPSTFRRPPADGDQREFAW